MALPMASSACLVIEYGPNAGADSTPEIDDMMMIRPEPRATILGRTAWVTARVPNTLTSNSRRTRSSGTSAIGPVWPAPALSISTSTSHSDALATSSVVMSSFSTVSSGASAERAAACSSDSVVAITVWPRPARANAAPRPKPDPAPVIMTVLGIAGGSSVAAVPRTLRPGTVAPARPTRGPVSRGRCPA